MHILGGTDDMEIKTIDPDLIPNITDLGAEEIHAVIICSAFGEAAEKMEFLSAVLDECVMYIVAGGSNLHQTSIIRTFVKKDNIYVRSDKYFSILHSDRIYCMAEDNHRMKIFDLFDHHTSRLKFPWESNAQFKKRNHLNNFILGNTEQTPFEMMYESGNDYLKIYDLATALGMFNQIG